MDVLRIQDAERRFGDVQALAGVSLAARAGEILALLGPNGAGKTTLVRAVAGRVRLDRGTIELAGRVRTPREPLPELGVVSQELALYARLTARENLELFGTLQGLAGAALAARVRWALDWIGLADRAAHLVGAFSGGMKRRLHVACAVLHEPRVLLLDEPTVGVDPQSREYLYGMFDQLRAGGAALVLTTHHLEEAEARCERIAIMDRGRIVAEGALESLVAHAGLAGRRVRVALEKPAREAPAGLALADDGRALTARVDDVGAEVPALLQRVHAAGHAVRDLEVRPASLQQVFLALTGKDLRE